MKTIKTAICVSAFVATALTMASTEGTAQTPCNQRDNVLGHLAQKYQEVPVAIGVTNQGGLVEVLSTGDGRTWTIIVSTPNGESCMVAAGQGWRTLPQAAATLDPNA